jgi:hypothetical protein
MNSAQQSVGAGTGTLVHTPTGVVLKTALHVFKPIFDAKGRCDDSGITIRIESPKGPETETLSCVSFLDPARGARQTDLATLKVSDRWKGTALPLAATLNTGDEILVIGFPEIMKDIRVASLGHVLMKTDLGVTRIVMSASASPGMSGGPVLKIGSEGRLELIGHLVNQLNADPLVALPIRYAWGAKTYERRICLSQDDYNGILYNGSHTEVGFKARLLMTTQFILKRRECGSRGWQWREGLQGSIRNYRELIDSYSGRKAEGAGALHDRLSQDYRDRLQKDIFKALKTADFPLSPGPSSSGPAMSSARFQEVLGYLRTQVGRFEEKLDRIERLFPESMMLADWLTAIEKLDLEHRVNAVNDYYLFGLGVMEIW